MSHLTFLRNAVLVIIFSAAVWLQTHIIISGDVTWLMHAGARLLAGGNYYKDFVEVNLPMAIFIYLIPVSLSKIFSISFITAITIYTFGIAGSSWLLCCFLLRRIFAPKDIEQRSIFEIILAFAWFILPAYAFAQREYFLCLFMLPYLLLAVLRLQSQLKLSNYHNMPGPIIEHWRIKHGYAVVIGVIAGIGFSIKPFFLMAWLLPEIYLLSRTKKCSILFRTEALSCFALVIVYNLVIAIFFSAYLTQNKSLVLSNYYLTYRVAFDHLLNQPLVFFALLTVVIYSSLRKKLNYQILADLLALSVISSQFIYFIQQTLWFYHILPSLLFTTLLSSLIAADYLQNYNPFKIQLLSLHLFRSLLSCFTFWLLFLYPFFIAVNNIKFAHYLSDAVFKQPIYAFAKSASGKPVYIFTDNLRFNYPLLDYAHNRSFSIFSSLWLLVGITRLEHLSHPSLSVQSTPNIANFVRTKEVDSLLAHPPAYIFVQTQTNFDQCYGNFLYILHCEALKKPAVDYLAFFLQDSRFAQFWQLYRKVGQSPDFTIYTRQGRPVTT